MNPDLKKTVAQLTNTITGREVYKVSEHAKEWKPFSNDLVLREDYEKLEQQNAELVEALKALLVDMHRRAKARGDVDSDGTVILDCGNGVLFKVDQAIAKSEAK